MSVQICKDTSVSKFKLHLFYNSGQGGSYRNIGYSVYDFSAVKIGGSDPTVHVLKFCKLGVSSPWPGSGQRLDAIVLRKAMNSSPSLRASLLKYVHAFMIQTTHTAVANARAKARSALGAVDFDG